VSLLVRLIIVIVLPTLVAAALPIASLSATWAQQWDDPEATPLRPAEFTSTLAKN
jgi:hypothetical protein